MGSISYIKEMFYFIVSDGTACNITYSSNKMNQNIKSPAAQCVHVKSITEGGGGVGEEEEGGGQRRGQSSVAKEEKRKMD